MKAFDYIIVGAGSAGCVLANRLSSDPSVRVLLIEAGGTDRNFWLRLPVGYFKTVLDPRFSVTFETECFAEQDARNVPWPRGRVLGGSSSINGLLYVRGQHQDFDDWEAGGATGWSYRDVLPYFKRSECYASGPSEYRGSTGELAVSNLRNRNRSCAAWLAAAQQLGLPLSDDLNGAMDSGLGSYQQTVKAGWRSSASSAFLRPVMRRPNLRVLTRAQVTRIDFVGQKASGVTWTSMGGAEQACVEREVILCAGSIQSPHLLQLSGIGPAESLRRYGIDVRVDAPEVGENLQDHFQVKSVLRLSRPFSLNTQVRNPFHLAGMGLQWLFGNSGPLTVGAGQVGGLATSPVSVDGRADLLFTAMPLSLDRVGTPLHRFSGFTAAVAQCRPASKGRLSLRSADPMAAPRIETNYLSEELDRRTLVAGLEMLRDIASQPAMRDLLEAEVLPGRQVTSFDALLRFARATGGTAYHPVGTCRMGSDEGAVVDPQLRVRGVERLRIVDASVMPRITSTNTNAAAIMIGERGADLIRRSPLR